MTISLLFVHFDEIYPPVTTMPLSKRVLNLQEKNQHTQLTNKVMAICNWVTKNESDTKRLLLQVDNVRKEIQELLASGQLWDLPPECTPYLTSLATRTDTLDTLLTTLIDILASIWKDLHILLQESNKQPSPSLQDTSLNKSLPTDTPRSHASTNSIPDERGIPNIVWTKKVAHRELSRINIHTWFSKTHSMTALWKSAWFIESFFQACEKLTPHFRVLIFSHSIYRVPSVIASDPTLDRTSQWDYQNIPIREYLESFATSFYWPNTKLVAAKMALCNLYHARSSGKELVFPYSPSKLETHISPTPIVSPHKQFITQSKWIFPEELTNLFNEKWNSTFKQELIEIYASSPVSSDQIRAVRSYLQNKIGNEFLFEWLRLSTTNTKIYKRLQKILRNPDDLMGWAIPDEFLHKLLHNTWVDGIKDLFQRIITTGSLWRFIQQHTKEQKLKRKIKSATSEKHTVDYKLKKERIPHANTKSFSPASVSNSTYTKIDRLIHLDPQNLLTSYEATYEEKFSAFFKKQLNYRWTPYTPDMHSIIDEFLQLFDQLYSELMYLVEQKLIYRNEVDALTTIFSSFIKKSNRSNYEHLWSELISYEYSKFKFRITPCLRKR